MSATEVRRELEIDAALLAIAAGLIHAVAAVSHFGQYWLFGASFAVLAPAQIAWGAMVYRGAGRALPAETVSRIPQSPAPFPCR